MMSIEELTVEYQHTGDEVVLREIFEGLGWLVRHCAKKYENIPHIEQEEREQELYIVLVDVIEDFDVTKNVKVTTMATKYFEQKMNRLYIKQMRQKRGSGATVCSYDEMIEVGGELETEAEIDEGFEGVELRLLFEQGSLTEKEIKTCLYKMEGYINTDIAEMLEVSNTMVANYLKNIRKKLRSTLKK